MKTTVNKIVPREKLGINFVTLESPRAGFLPRAGRYTQANTLQGLSASEEGLQRQY